MKVNIIFIILLFIISVFAFSPHENIPKTIDTFYPNIKHVFAFFVISFYMYYYKKTKILNIFWFVLIFGTYIEIVQGLFTARDFSLYDVIYDIFGYIILIFLFSYKVFLDKIIHYLIINNKGNRCHNKK